MIEWIEKTDKSDKSKRENKHNREQKYSYSQPATEMAANWSTLGVKTERTAPFNSMHKATVAPLFTVVDVVVGGSPQKV